MQGIFLVHKIKVVKNRHIMCFLVRLSLNLSLLLF